jgi:hypothetical protein
MTKSVEKDWADRRAEDVLKLVHNAANDEAAREVLADSFRDLARSCEPRHPLDM